MKSFSLDFHGGMLRDEVRDTYPNSNIPIEFNQLEYDKDNSLIESPRPVAYNLFDIFRLPYTGRNVITGWLGQISSSLAPIELTPKQQVLRVDVWLSDRPCGKMSSDVLARLETGNTGSGSGGISGLALPMPPTIYMNYWTRHKSLDSLRVDWHCWFIVYYQ